MGSTFWPSVDVENLRRLVAEGYTGSQIAARLRVAGGSYTRNAVIGKIHRLGLRMARKPSSSLGVPRANNHCRGPRVRTREPAAAPVVDTLPSTVEQSTTAARASTPPDSGSRRHLPPADGFSPGEALAGLEAGDCRWPIGTVGDRDFHFCGQARGKHVSYCPAHARTAKSTSKGEPYGWLR